MRRLKDYYNIANWVLDRFVNEMVLIEGDRPLADIIKAHPKLIGVFNHGPAISPLIYCFSALKHYCQAGGADRVPVAVTHRLFYKFPILKQVATYITQLDYAPRCDELVQLFSEPAYNDLMVMPEGDHSAFGNGLEVAPFRTHRFIEIAFRTQTPLLLCAQTGAETWCYPFSVDTLRWDRWINYLPQGIKSPLVEMQGFNLPSYPRKIERVCSTFRVLTPEDWPKYFDPKNPVDAAHVVRGLLQEMVQSLQQSPPDNHSLASNHSVLSKT